MAAFILEAGLTGETLRAEVEAMAAAAARAGVAIVGGDTKVVEHGMADGMYVTTFGFGEVDARARLGPARVREGDRVLLSGPIGDHGITILLARGELDLEADLGFGHALGRAIRRRAARFGRRRAALDARSDARRRGHGAQRAGARDRTRYNALRRSDSAARRGARSLRDSRPRSAAHRQRRAASCRCRARQRRCGAGSDAGRAGRRRCRLHR